MLKRVERSLGFGVIGVLCTHAFAYAQALPPEPIAHVDEPDAKLPDSRIRAARLPALSLQEAIDYARLHDLSLKSAKARLAAAELQAEAPGAAWYPTVGVGAQVLVGSANNWTGLALPGRGFDMPRVGATQSNTFDFKPYGSTAVGVGINQTVYDFGRIAAQGALQRAMAVSEKERARNAEIQSVFLVEESFVAVLTAKAVLRSAREAETRARAVREQAAAQVASGMRPQGHLARAEADLARYEAAVVRSGSSVAIAQSVLAAAIGHTAAKVDAKDEAPRTTELPSMSMAVAKAKKDSPRILAKLAELDAEQASARSISAETRPQLGLSASFSGRAGGATSSTKGVVPLEGAGFLPYVPNYHVGLVFSWTLFDASVNARVKVADARASARAEELQQVNQEETLRVHRAYIDYQAARDTLAPLTKAVTAARTNVDQLTAGYAAGLGTSVELASGVSILVEAETQRAIANFGLMRARAEIARLLSDVR
jgi:outer membrane protein